MAESDLTPYQDAVIDENRLMSRAWQSFFRTIDNLVLYIKREQSFPLVNNQAVAANITGLSFDYRFTSQATIEYLIQRTTSTPESLIQTGIMMVVYQPRTNNWSILEYGTSGPDASGITFTITAAGQVQYTSTNQAGTKILSRIIYRVREIAGKASLYSQLG